MILKSILNRLLIAAAAFSGLSATVRQVAAAAPARVKIVNGSVVGANGERLRGAPVFLDVFTVPDMQNNETGYRDYFRSISRDYKLNCVRVCPWIGNWQNDIKNNTDHKTKYLYMLDKYVQWAEEDGIYCIVNMHIQFGTTVDITKSNNFWSVVAPRYKDKTHVVYEAVNEPDLTTVRTNMDDVYSYIRGQAPNTHIICWSLADPGINDNGSILKFTINDLRSTEGQKISYTNASVGFHNYPYQDEDSRRFDKAKEYRDGGFPVICTEFQSFQNADNGTIYYPWIRDSAKFSENYNMGWVQWSPRFNPPLYNESLNGSGTTSEIKFVQKWKDELIAEGVNFFGSNLNGVYEIKCKNGGFVLATPNSSVNPTSLVMANPVVSDNKQRWTLTQVSSNLYRINNNIASNLYMHANGNTAGSSVTVLNLNTSWTSQQWYLELVSANDYRLKCAWGNFYLQGANSSGTAVRVQALSTTNNNQVWTLNKK
jgi:hypothetical protein